MIKMTKKLKQNAAYLGLPLVLALIVIVRARHSDEFVLLLHMLLIVFGYIAAVQDIKTKQISNKLIMAMIGLWAVMGIAYLLLQTPRAVTLLIDSAIGFVLGGGLFLLIYLVSRKGIGGGDVKFMAASGLYLGFYGIISTTLYGSILAALIGLVLIVLKKLNRKDTMPLAPFLFAGILITVFLSNLSLRA